MKYINLAKHQRDELFTNTMTQVDFQLVLTTLNVMGRTDHNGNPYTLEGVKKDFSETLTEFVDMLYAHEFEEDFISTGRRGGCFRFHAAAPRPQSQYWDIEIDFCPTGYRDEIWINHIIYLITIEILEDNGGYTVGDRINIAVSASEESIAVDKLEDIYWGSEFPDYEVIEFDKTAKLDDSLFKSEVPTEGATPTTFKMSRIGD